VVVVEVIMEGGGESGDVVVVTGSVELAVDVIVVVEFAIEVEVAILTDAVVVDGPAGPEFKARAKPRRAESMLRSFPSTLRAQIPTPPIPLALAIWAASYNEVGSSKNVSCH
jgi:hypothetical protein